MYKLIGLLFFFCALTEGVPLYQQSAELSCNGQDVSLTTDICWCNAQCIKCSDCCTYHGKHCGKKGLFGNLNTTLQVTSSSCAGRCDQSGVDDNAPCQCNSACDRHDDCCSDYEDVCINRRPTDLEIMTLTEQLYAMDSNRLSKSSYTIDRTGKRFITYVDKTYLSRPTFAAFFKLLDNYNPKLGVPESDCASCRKEAREFILAIMETRLMQRVWAFLSDKGFASQSEQGFRDQLYNYWFRLYSRSGGVLDSSGFEHVFVGEFKGTTVSGFHNWLQFYQEEKNNHLVYRRYVAGCQPEVHLTSFHWDNKFKSVSSMFMGTSPEFEMAVYTLCFLTRKDDTCRVSLDSKKLDIVTFIMPGSSPKAVGTAYPDC